MPQKGGMQRRLTVLRALRASGPDGSGGSQRNPAWWRDYNEAIPLRLKIKLHLHREIQQ